MLRFQLRFGGLVREGNGNHYRGNEEQDSEGNCDASVQGARKGPQTHQCLTAAEKKGRGWQTGSDGPGADLSRRLNPNALAPYPELKCRREWPEV